MIEYNEPDSFWRIGKMRFEQELELAARRAKKEAIREEAIRIAKALIDEGMSEEKVVKITGLTHEEVENIRH